MARRTVKTKVSISFATKRQTDAMLEKMLKEHGIEIVNVGAAVAPKATPSAGDKDEPAS